MAVRIRPGGMVPEDENHAYFELNADTASDLTGLDTKDGYSIIPGSLCHVIATGHIFALDGSGDWIDQMEA